MATAIILPRQGNSVETCLILEWKKKKGEEIKKGEIICEIETDKAVFEIESPDSGIVLETFFNEGEDVPVLTNIAVIGSKGENYDEYFPGLSKKNKKEEHTKSELNSITSALVDNNESEDSYTKDIPSGNEKKISVRAKKLADRLKLAIDKIEGTGPGNRIIEKDVLAASKNYEYLTLAAAGQITESNPRPESGSGIGNRITTIDLQTQKQAQAPGTEDEAVKVVPLKGIRKIIAERMLESLKNSAQLTLNSSANATALLNLRKRFKNSSTYKELQQVTINDLIHFAVIKTLPGHPELNSLLIGDSIEYYQKIHLGFAVDTPRGLMVPVIKNSQDLNLLQLSNEAKRLASASISGKIEPKELGGATFTVTNLGNFGVESFTPVLNLPQTAILGVNNISLKPVGVENNIEFIPHISFSLTIDHRAIDGATGAKFLQSLSGILSEIDLAITEIIGKR